MGFMVANVVLVKTMLPYAIYLFVNRPLPNIISESNVGQTFWAAIFCFTIVLPLSLPRQLASIAYTNILCMVFGFYFLLSVVLTCLNNRMIVPELGPSLKMAAFHPSLSVFTGIASSIPVVVFSFLI